MLSVRKPKRNRPPTTQAQLPDLRRFSFEQVNKAPKTTGVYAIHCRVNDFIYIGSTAVRQGFRRRLTCHFSDLQNGRHHSYLIQRDWKRYGVSAFDFYVLEECSPLDCTLREQAWINIRGVGEENRSYNLSPRASSCLGVKHTLEAVTRMSEAHKGKPWTEAQRKNIPPALQARWKNTPKSPVAVQAMVETRMRNKRETFKAIAPDGKEFYFKNVKGFCRQFNLAFTHVYPVMRGQRDSYKGWKFERLNVDYEVTQITPELIKKYSQMAVVVHNGGRPPTLSFKITSPFGEVFTTSHIDSFCQTIVNSTGEYKSCRPSSFAGGLRRVATGKRPHYRGWKAEFLNGEPLR
jgi:group I intron endonuclease